MVTRTTPADPCPASDPDAVEAGALEKIRPFLDAVNFSPDRLPCNTADAILILAEGGEYEISASTIAEFVRKKYVAKPTGGKWFAFDLYMWSAALEMRRRWQPFSVHAAKQSHYERMQDLATAAGADAEFFRDLADHSVEDLCLYLAKCDDPQARWGLFLALRQKLGDRFYE